MPARQQRQSPFCPIVLRVENSSIDCVEQVSSGERGPNTFPKPFFIIYVAAHPKPSIKMHAEILERRFNVFIRFRDAASICLKIISDENMNLDFPPQTLSE